MQKKFSLFLFLFIITNDIVFGKHKNKTKSVSPAYKTSSDLKNKQLDRNKRSFNDNSDTLFSTSINDVSSKTNLDEIKFYSDPKLDEPFWANRGRRESSEIFDNFQAPVNIKSIGNIRGFKPTHDTVQGKLEDNYPFWGNRGRRDSLERVENHPYSGEKIIKYRERKQEDEPFWGTRGRREEDPPWRNRGQRQDFLIRPDEDDPFWGNRGRRQETEPFWGNRGRRDLLDPFWSSRGKKEESINYLMNDETDPFWGNRGRRKLGLKESIIEAINDVKENIDEISKSQSGNIPFWSSRGRDSKIKHLFNGPARYRTQKDLFKPINPNTVTNSEMYVEEPHFILVERSSRSSGEIDPFYISRGKKYSEPKETDSARDRRGALEELVKTVRNDPYYIARGKKSIDFVRIGNISVLKDDIIKAKELICAIVDMLSRHQDNKVKREVTNVNERDRRTILKKLALQLQTDPYFLSRGKKDVKERTDVNIETLNTFFNHLTAMCI